ncbi:MAG: GNAT family N-acetyltransferase [Desulfobacterales bacterium]|nr:GNAT family N-acetyltransferase [Desulfobacterales bacterium]
MAWDPFEALRRDLERISRALRPGRLPATLSVRGRTFVAFYTSVKEATGLPGTYIAEIRVVEVGEGFVGGVSLAVTPQKETARVEWASVTPRGIGLGRAIVEAVERDLKARGYYLVELLAVPDSIPFWKALGYIPQAEDVPGEALEMAKMLYMRALPGEMRVLGFIHSPPA